ncbi:MAG: hypothetical protein A4S12_13595 [Proteobacteria bacterium SG_bin5]|nr:hypothetical protein [Sphingomonas sp.]OQW44228.1 MAG: hypothetical protein A4S12_13595 [Proteobacteria bacterium SG_bin5]
MSDLLHKMRKIEIVVGAEDVKLVEDALRDAGLGGWTILRDVAGMGHHGFHQARTIFNDQTGLVMFVGVGPAEAISGATSRVGSIFRHKAGVMFVSDVEVLRSDYFVTA